ncbi:sugar phosphate isomerase/epimerase [Humisphaera borealis]|uniref:Sugar phosphate isomerase/epimerase n=2 Tax=Humisphaera borealis TaxID=2807512 RepID=A0A7M2WXU8_9BACT|nr:sugar phosphate isomerase/epimerase [Humisphaera borealis]
MAGVAIAGPRASALLADDADIYGGLKMGIQSYSLRDRSFEKMLDAMKNDLKLKYVECYPAHTAGRAPTANLKMLEDAGVKMVSYGVVGFGKDEKANRALFDIAKTYSLENLSCNPPTDKGVLEQIDKLAEEYKITLAIHPHGPGSTWPTADVLAKGFEGRSTRLGLCADTGHLIRAGEDPVKVCMQFKDRLHALHLKDFKKLEGNNKWEDVPAGTANLDVPGLVKFLLAEKFSKPIFIEYEGKEPVAAIQKSLAAVADAVKKAKA